jgi:hypothetical protein
MPLPGTVTPPEGAAPVLPVDEDVAPAPVLPSPGLTGPFAPPASEAAPVVRQDSDKSAQSGEARVPVVTPVVRTLRVAGTAVLGTAAAPTEPAVSAGHSAAAVIYALGSGTSGTISAAASSFLTTYQAPLSSASLAAFALASLALLLFLLVSPVAKLGAATYRLPALPG